MSKRTLALVIALVAVTALLVAVALSPQTKTPQAPASPSQVGPTTPTAKPAPASETVLSLSPNPVVASPQATATANVDITTGSNNVTAVQLELSFDPTVVSNVSISGGTFFANAIELIKKVDQKAGTITFALGISPNDTAKTGTGTVATITFTAKGASGTQSPISFSQKTLVTASGASSSILKSTTGTVVVLR